MLAGMDETDTGQWPEEPPEGLAVVDLLLQAVEQDPSNVQQFQTVALFIDMMKEQRVAANKAYMAREKRWENLKLQLNSHVAARLQADEDCGKTLLGTTHVRGATKPSVSFDKKDKALAQWLIDNGHGGAVDMVPVINANAKDVFLDHLHATGELPEGVEFVEPRPIVVNRFTAKPTLREVERKASQIAITHTSYNKPDQQSQL